MLNYALCSLDTLSYHLVNNAIHLVYATVAIALIHDALWRTGAAHWGEIARSGIALRLAVGGPSPRQRIRQLHHLAYRITAVAFLFTRTVLRRAEV